jgi:selenide,water dikinase
MPVAAADSGKKLIHYSVGEIAFSNVVSDIYSCGVVNIDELKIILSIPTELTDEEQQQVVPQIIRGFQKSAKLVKCRLTIEKIHINPWFIIGGIATAYTSRDEIVFPTNCQANDVLILTKALGVQLATNVKLWFDEKSENWTKLSEHLTEQNVEECYAAAVKSMTMLNHLGAQLMHKYEAHAATDITGFGLVGHAENLLKFQELELDFIIERLPIIKHVPKIAQVLNRQQKLFSGRAVETSGGLLISLPSTTSKQFCEEFEQRSSGCGCWIIGHVQVGSRTVIAQNMEIVEV